MRRRGLIATSLSLPFLGSSARAATPPTVLELFTSQGCSSCPPADALLGELSGQPGIIALAWHVDYWNSLGWRDPYARHDWTLRQQSYAHHLNDEVYTPALVVNGATMVVGSNRAAVRSAIAGAAPPTVGVTLRRTPAGIEAEVSGAGPGMTGLLVTYDPQHATAVKAGENQGRELIEYRVVRSASLIPALGSGLVSRPPPEGTGVVLMVQDAAWRVSGAADLPPGA